MSELAVKSWMWDEAAKPKFFLVANAQVRRQSEEINVKTRPLLAIIAVGGRF